FSGHGVGYAYDLDAIGRYYQQCQKLMAHWKRLAPLTIVDVHYEALVANPEPETRALLEALGLEWDRRCLAFYEAKRQVRTVSEWQVREPIHTRSVERWRRHEKHLEPLRKYLD
ncbi:MAG: sulfotransferase, partial [Deltaproteobacteria bacterium]|nr:sulfotransferase [Deltaproteobacteria bacterium]